MAILKIARMGHPVLLRRAEVVADPSNPEIARLAADMIETMLDAGGLGLAGPQVHVPLRIFVMQLPADRSGEDALGPMVVINPIVEALGEERVLRWEGCLSIPGLRARRAAVAARPLQWGRYRGRAGGRRGGRASCQCRAARERSSGWHPLYHARHRFLDLRLQRGAGAFSVHTPAGQRRMIAPPERSPERDAAIEAMLKLVPRLGWTREALREAGAERLFPGGGADVVEAYIDLADRRMAEGAELAGLRLTARVRTLLVTRFAQAEPEREAVRRAAALLALPGNVLLAARCTARTVDAVWFAAGDTSADFSWYTKRALLAGVYSSTLLYWLSTNATREGTEAFLDRRLAGVARIGKLRARFSKSRAGVNGPQPL